MVILGNLNSQQLQFFTATLLCQYILNPVTTPTVTKPSLT